MCISKRRRRFAVREDPKVLVALLTHPSLKKGGGMDGWWPGHPDFDSLPVHNKMDQTTKHHLRALGC